VTANLTVTATFAIDQYTLTYNAGPNGSITGTTLQTVDHGADGTEVTAVPNVGYHFVQWSDGVLTASRTDLNVTANLTVTAEFAEKLVVVSQVYGGGGRSGAVYTHDFIELFNRGSLPIDISDWTIQYAPAGSATWTATTLSGTIQPHAYFLIQHASGGGGTTPLPTPDATGSTDLSELSGKIALVSSLSVLTGICPNSSAIEDLVGYGTADCSETSPATGGSNTIAVLRGFGGCVDTDDNSQDFNDGAPTPRNSASPVNTCEFTLTTLVDPSTAGTIGRSPDLSAYGPGAIVQLTATAGPNWHFDHWSGGASGSTNPLSLPMNSNITVTAHFVTNATAGKMVISQFFGGGGDGDGLKNDYVELYNRGNGSVNVDGWTIQHAGATGTVWNSTPLTGNVSPGRYLLVQLFAAGGGTQSLPVSPDVTGAIDIHATAGKIALVCNGTALIGTCPTGVGIVDFVGYGGADCSEASPTAAITAVTAGFRGYGGCDETDDNLADFESGTPAPRNSGTPAHICDFWVGADGAIREMSLAAAGPNPAMGSARFSLALPSETRVRLTVTDVMGRRIAWLANGPMPAGRHEIAWGGTGTAGAVRSGLYYLTLEAMGRRVVRSFVLMR
jgi:predicted extracellular nuclease